MSDNTQRLLKIWEEGGPVKLLKAANDQAYYIMFNNYQNLNYNKLVELLEPFGKCLSIRQFSTGTLRVRYKTEEEIRKCYNALKADERFKVTVHLDVQNYYENHPNSKKGSSKHHRRSRIVDRTDLDCEGELQRTLEREANIKFTKPLSHKVQGVGPKRPSDEPPPPGSVVGTYKGQIVVMPEKPFVNKYLKPPPRTVSEEQSSDSWDSSDAPNHTSRRIHEEESSESSIEEAPPLVTIFQLYAEWLQQQVYKTVTEYEAASKNRRRERHPNYLY